MNVFLDTNVVIDFMGEREGFFEDAAAIFTMIEDKRITASASALTIVNCAYILKKAFSSEVMLDKVEALCQMLNVTPIDRSQLVNAQYSSVHTTTRMPCSICRHFHIIQM